MKRAMLAAVGLVLLLLPGSVHAEEELPFEVLEVGWWSSRPTAVAQPEEGFEVAAGPTGEAESVAAIRLSITPGTISSLSVRLDDSTTSQLIAGPGGILRVCTTVGTWTTANPGPYDEAPEPDCAAGVNLTLTEDGYWIGDVGSLAPTGGEVSLMVVPEYKPAPVGPGMIVTIAAGQFNPVGTPVAGTTDTTLDSGGGFEPPADDFVVPNAGAFGIDTQEFTPSFGPTETTIAPSVPADPTVESGSDDFALDPIANEGDTKPWGRIIVLIPLCAVFGVGGVYLRRFLSERGYLPA